MSITDKGYYKYYDSGSRNNRYAHRKVWRDAHGPVPQGFFIHHKDGDKTNNDINNLVLLDALTHNRIHSGCYKVDGRWIKPCKRCGIEKDLENDFNKASDGYPRSWCKKCMHEYEKARLKKKRAANKLKMAKNTDL